MSIENQTISLSKYLKVTRTELERKGVFDATLGIDTKLFVDPKLLVKSKIYELKNSRESVLSYFDLLLRVHKESLNIPRLRDKAIDMLAVREPKGLSIGYGNKSDNGTSISKNVARKILISVSELIAVGIEDKEIFELLSLFVEDFGPDSISDLTIHIIYDKLCLYTERVCNELKIKTNTYKIDNHVYELPKHPFKKSQLIFVPHLILRPLPVVSSWDEISYASQQNEETRNTFNKIIRPVILGEIEQAKSKKVKLDINKHKNIFLKLIDIYRQIDINPYNLENDDKGYYSIQPYVENIFRTQENAIHPKDSNSLVRSVKEIIAQFKKSIEFNGANRLLYHKNSTGVPIPWKPHREDVSQTLFYCISDVECKNRGIILSREPNAGLGPVDFSLSTTIGKLRSKVLVEIKKSNNNSLLSGFRKQITKYEESEDAQFSYYVVIVINKQNLIKPQLRYVEQEFKKRLESGIYSPELIIIDGLIHPSPSKL